MASICASWWDMPTFSPALRHKGLAAPLARAHLVDPGVLHDAKHPTVQALCRVATVSMRVNARSSAICTRSSASSRLRASVRTEPPQRGSRAASCSRTLCDDSAMMHGYNE